MLVYEATRDAPREAFTVQYPLAQTTGYRLAQPPLLVSVLRAGLGMVDQANALMPDARVGFVGVARNEQTHQPTPYLGRCRTTQCPARHGSRPDAGHRRSMLYTLGLLACRGAVDVTVVCVVAAPEGIAALERHAPNVRLFTAAIDDGLNEIAYIVPGLGDAGDRQFGPR